MLSPFPGMDPYLENSELWPAVHNRLILAIADDLVDHLSEKYRVEIEKRTYFGEDEGILVGIPDVAVATGKAAKSTPATTTLTLPIQPEKVTVPVTQEVIERYLEIREVATGRVITVIELLSPKNKRSGEGRIAYERKRSQILTSTTNLVEIDLLRGGRPFPMSSKQLNDYRILVCRGDQRPTGELYAFNIRQPIPPIPIPVMLGESDILLEIQPLINRVYDKGRYHLAIDYTQPPVPQFSAEDNQWAAELLS
ncbi:MAG: DUF4058 family protein [Cyanobacteria bacterium P01_G01_bin.38]